LAASARNTISKAENRLLHIALGEADGRGAFELCRLLADPMFERLSDIPERERAWDWRSHVPEEIALAWHTLSLESQLVAYICADQHADTERE
jgi:hypothetical protein